VAERPILFSAPMVRALLAGTKTQTRRVVKPQPDNPETFGVSPIWGQGVLREHLDPQQRFHVHAAFNEGGKRVDRWLPCPFGAPGDRLWVRETFITTPKRWTDDWALFDKESRKVDGDGDMRAVQYLATAPDREGANGWGLKATPSIFMPRWASRITLEVTGVRVERLKDISETDSLAEGVEPMVHECWSVWEPTCEATVSLMVEPTPEDIARHGYQDVRHIGPKVIATAADRYMILWDSINGPGAASKNPWVWVVEFKRVAHGA
jgi:hypothetical protein